MQKAIAELIETLQQSLGDTQEARLATAIVAELSKLSLSEMSYLSYSTLSRLAHTSPSDPLLLGAIASLTSQRTRVLEIFFMYIMDDVQETYVSAADYRSAEERGYLIHPISGELDTEFDEHISPYFRATEDFAGRLES